MTMLPGTEFGQGDSVVARRTDLADLTTLEAHLPFDTGLCFNLTRLRIFQNIFGLLFFAGESVDAVASSNSNGIVFSLEIV